MHEPARLAHIRRVGINVGFQIIGRSRALDNGSGWSEKHGRYDELGKSGQSSVNRNTVQWHLDNHLRETVAYEEIAETLARVTKDDA